MLGNVLNFILFQLGWLATVVGAAAAYPWLGPVFTLAWLAVHLPLFSRQPVIELQFLLLCALAGYVADSLLVLAGMLAFPPTAQLGWPSTLWMVALWLNLGMTINHSLAWLAGRPWLGMAFGLLGGPAAYYLGSTMNAIMLLKEMTSLIAIGLLWAVAMPGLLYASGRFLPGTAMSKITPMTGGDSA